MQFQIAQGHHGADGETVLVLFDGVQAQLAQVDGGVDHAAAQTKPEHTAQNTAAFILI